MKDQTPNQKTNDKAFSESLKSIASDIEVNPGFQTSLEKQLIGAYQPAGVSLFFSIFNRAMPTLGWLATLAFLILMLNWVIRSIAPPPVPAAQETSTASLKETPSPVSTRQAGITTPMPNEAGYDWRGTKLYLSQSLPVSPAEANVYLKKIAEPLATRADILALAQRFEINGEIHEVAGDIPGTTNYRISDGRERLEVRPDHSFTYHSNFGEQLYLDNLSEGQARSIADNFLKKHGFDFEYKLESSQDMKGTQFYILPLTPDGYEMHFDYMQSVRYEILFDNTGENIIFIGYSIEYELVTSFGIITANEAFQRLLDPSPQTGVLETVRGQGGGGGGGIGFYKLNLSGTQVPFPSPTTQPEANPFNVEYIVQENDTLTSIALNYGLTIEELMQTNGLTNSLISVGQKLIISSEVSNQDLIGQRIEGKRGTFTVSIYRMQDGSQRVEYALSSMPKDDPSFFAILEGTGLEDLQTYHNLPLDVWGTISRIDQNGDLVVQVERYEIPFPELRIQVLEGTQQTTELDGRSVILFTSTDGTTYIQIMPNGEPDASILGFEGESVILESLAIPGETFGVYPALRVFSGSIAVNPKNSETTEGFITADQPYILDESPPELNTTYPTATIETVELVYYTSDPRYPRTNATAEMNYIQPVWRFYGHYSTGDEFEFLVQALKQEYLLPEILPHMPPG